MFGFYYVSLFQGKPREPGRSLDPMQRYFRHCPAAEAGINFGFSYGAKDGFAKCGKVIAASYLVRLHA